MTELEQKVAPLDMNALSQAIMQTEDMTVETSFERELPAAGPAWVRLLDYVELGMFAPVNPNPKHDPKPKLKVKLKFELCHPRHSLIIDGVAKPHTITVTLNKSTNAKANFKKMFNKMNEALGGKHTHITTMLGLPMKAKVYHKPGKAVDGATPPVYANLDNEGWSFEAAEIVDDLTLETKPLAVPALVGTPSVFLWEPKRHNDKGDEIISDDFLHSMWESIYIEGTYTRTVGDEEKEYSRNFYQDKIKENLQWEGSYSQSLFEDSLDLDELDSGHEALAQGAVTTCDDEDELNLD